MAELPDRIPGEIIFASYENEVKQRTAQRYADNSQRDALNPLPEDGALAYITSTDELQIFNGSTWVVFYLSTAGGVLTGKLSTSVIQDDTGQFRNIHILPAAPTTQGIDGDIAFVVDGSP